MIRYKWQFRVSYIFALASVAFSVYSASGADAQTVPGSVVQSQSIAVPQSAPATLSAEGDLGTQLAPGDLVILSVFEAPELTGPVRVTPAGTLELPLIGGLHVAGMTTQEAAALVRDRLIAGAFLKNPQVTMGLSDRARHAVIVFGEVLHPGATAVSGVTGLWDVVGAAGGVTQLAGTNVVVRHQDAEKTLENYTLDWDRPMNGQPNPEVRPGDTVQVTRAGLVYVLGQVVRQGGYPFSRSHLTIAQAIALANGINYTAKSKHARLIRRSGGGHVVQEVDVSAIIKGDAPDVSLEDNDILYIPNSIAKVALSRGIEAAIGITTQVGIYRSQQ